MKSINLEIRDAEGGTDAKLLVREMHDIYSKTAKMNNLDCQTIEVRDGFVHLCF